MCQLTLTSKYLYSYLPTYCIVIFKIVYEYSSCGGEKFSDIGIIYLLEDYNLVSVLTIFEME